MTPQEEQLLNSLIDRVNQTTLQEKDPDAEALLNQKLASNPDALYMLAQTVLVQNIALEQAKAQLRELQQKVEQLEQARPQPAHTTSFLGRLLGERDRPAPPPQQQAAPLAQPAPGPQQQAPSPTYQQVPPQYAPPAQPYPQYGQPQYAQTQYVPAGGQPSFLQGAMQTAAGVAAGALAFEGVESILHGFGHGGYGYGGPGYGIGGGVEERPVEVINNYYDEPGRGGERGEHSVADQGQQFTDTSYDPRNNDPNDNLRGFDDQNAASSNDQNMNAANDASDFADQAGFGDQNLDDGGSGFDDNGGFDDGGGGGFDDSGGGF